MQGQSQSWHLIEVASSLLSALHPRVVPVLISFYALLSSSSLYRFVSLMLALFLLDPWLQISDLSDHTPSGPMS